MKRFKSPIFNGWPVWFSCVSIVVDSWTSAKSRGWWRKEEEKKETKWTFSLAFFLYFTFILFPHKMCSKGKGNVPSVMGGKVNPSMIGINVQVNEKVQEHDRWGLESYTTERCADWIESRSLRRALKMHFLSFSCSFSTWKRRKKREREVKDCLSLVQVLK